MNLICGINPVLEALQAGTRHFDRLLVVKGLRNPRVSEAIARASQRGVPLRFESRETLDRMAAGVPHQGVIAVVSAKPTLDLEQLLSSAREPALLVVLDGVEDPRNLGAILRTAEASGADGVVLPERHSAGLSETVARSSAGALEHVRVAKVGNLAQAVERIKETGIWVVGFDASGRDRWDAVDYKRPMALVLGGEGRGIRRLVRERCDQVVSIPLFGHVGSLNVSVAAGVALYEVIRQRGTQPSHVRPIPPGAVAPSRQVVGPAADDTEHDPGRSAPPQAELGDGSEHEEEHPVSVVGLHEDEVAWGPTLEKAAQRAPHEGRSREAGERARDPERRGRKRRGAQRGDRRGAEGRPPHAGPRAGEGDEARRGAESPREPRTEGGALPQGQRRRRRRRRGRGPGVPPGGGPRPEGAAPGVPPEGAEGGESGRRPDDGVPPGAGEGGREPGGGHRRRRRRRR